jgi:hypothetical protein
MPTYRFGKHPRKSDYRTLRFKNYLTPAVPPPPPACSVLNRVYQGTKTTNPTTLFPMDGNDTYGDCTIAAAAHAVTVYSGLDAKLDVAPTQTVVAQYQQLTGGKDTGLNELDVLKYWGKQTMFGDKILAFTSIDPKDHTHVQQAMQLFGGVYLGFQVPKDCIQQFDHRQTWTPGPLTNDGHAVFAVEYDQNTVTVLTWGNIQKATWAWWDDCVDEAYAIVPPEAQDSTFAPGFNVKQLVADLAAVRA